MNPIASRFAANAGNDTPTTASATDPTAGLANQDVFLKLLVAQISNQNPLQPADGLEFVSQLAQFTSLEQQMQMSQDLKAIRDALEPPPASGSHPASRTEPGTSINSNRL